MRHFWSKANAVYFHVKQLKSVSISNMLAEKSVLMHPNASFSNWKC